MGEENKGRAGPGKIRLAICDPEMQVQHLKRDVFKILNMANVQHFYFVPNSQINVSLKMEIPV